MIKYYRKANRNFPTADLKECFLSKKTTKENHLKLRQCSMLCPSYYPYIQIWCLNFWTASFKCRPTQTLYDHHLFFTSVVNYITAENKIFALKSLTRVPVTFIVVASRLMVELLISVQRFWTLAIMIQIHDIFHKTRLTNCNPAAMCCVISMNCQERIGFQN